MTDSTITINTEIANEHGGVTFNNGPDATSNGLIFSNIDWASGTLIVDEWAGTLSQDVFQDGYKYSVRGRYDTTPSTTYENLWDVAYIIDGKIVLEWSSTYWAVYLNSEETGYINNGWQNDTNRLLGGDEMLQILLTGDNTQFLEAIFSHDVTFNLGDGDDVVYGYAGDDTIYAEGGDDIIYGGSGHDTLYGGDGNDRIVGGDGQDAVYGGDGNDTIIVGLGDYAIYGGSGNDTIHSNYYYNTNIQGGDGDDLFINPQGKVYGGDGEDTVTFHRDSTNYILSKSPGDNVIKVSFYSGYTMLFATSVESFQFRDKTISAADVGYIGDYSSVIEDRTNHRAPYTYDTRDYSIEESAHVVYRLYNTRYKAYFYTSNSDERDTVIFNSAPRYTSGDGVFDYSKTDTGTYYTWKGRSDLVTNTENLPGINLYRNFEGMSYRSSEPKDLSKYLAYYEHVDYYGDTRTQAVSIFDYNGTITVPILDIPSRENLTESKIFVPDSYGLDTSWPYVYQGSTFEVAHTYSNYLAPVQRFFNYETGHHFYTTNADEAAHVKAKSAAGEWPYNYEGTGFNVYSQDPNPGYSGSELEIHRFFNPTSGRHFFTGDVEEANLVKLTGLWNYEGIAFFGETI